MKLKTSAVIAAAMALTALVCLPLGAQPAPTTAPATAPARRVSEFIRFVPDKHGGGQLETATATYRNADGVTVDLIGALHVGDKSYYAGLNDDFEKYDALLYELVMPKGARPPAPGAPSRNAVGMVQHFMKDSLGLDFQLDDIDYTKKNFVHADLDSDTFFSLQAQRGESFFSIMLQSMLRNLAKEAGGESTAQPITLIDLLAALRAPDRTRQLKLLLAQEFDQIEDEMSGLDGPNGSVIITERNKKCLDTMKQSIADGDRHIGIFFGAGHMHDLSARLKDLGFTKTATHWRVAWDMTAKPATQPATQISN